MRQTIVFQNSTGQGRHADYGISAVLDKPAAYAQRTLR